MTSVQIILISLYFVLLIICGGMWLISDQFSLAVRDSILPIASDGFKLVLGALVGTLSAILGTKSH